MPKLKTRKTLMKRIRITRNGKLIKKQNANGHLKMKMNSSRHTRKKQRLSQPNKGAVKVVKRLLAKAGKDL